MRHIACAKEEQFCSAVAFWVAAEHFVMAETAKVKPAERAYMMDMDTVAGMGPQSLEFMALEILFRCRGFMPAMWMTISGMMVNTEEPSDDGTVINILINKGAYVGVTKYTHSCRLI